MNCPLYGVEDLSLQADPIVPIEHALDRATLGPDGVALTRGKSVIPYGQHVHEFYRAKIGTWQIRTGPVTLLLPHGTKLRGSAKTKAPG